MTKKPTNLFFFTAQYPYGKAETFVESELNYLSKQFLKIYIFPLSFEGEKRSIPENAVIVDWKKDLNYKPLKYFFQYLPTFIKIFFMDWIRCKEKIEFIKGASYWKSLFLHNIARAEALYSSIKNLPRNNNVYYTFWLNEWATVLGLMKSKNQIPFFYSRIHGYDLYEERWNLNVIPFMKFNLKKVRKVIAISKNGERYLKKKFPSLSHKITCSYLGIEDRGTNPFSRNSSYTIVSCSNLIPLKRVNLIIEILKSVKTPVNWIHFGDGILKEELQKKAEDLPAHISYDFKGLCTNEEVIDFYRQHTVHLLIHTSETEGLPVALMEAVSFGIPLLATDVGGTNEIVNSTTGYLITPDFNPIEIAQKIDEFIDSQKNTEYFRNNVKKFWIENFEATKNYQSFYKELASD